MRRLLITALAAVATVALASPAAAQVAFQDQNGPDLTTAIHAASSGTSSGTTVYGGTCWPGCSNVAFSGYAADGTTPVSIDITGGSGFASITDTAGGGTLYDLTMTPTQTFTDYEFSLQLVNDGTITMMALVSGSWVTVSPNAGFAQNANEDDQYILNGNGAILSAVEIISNSPIFEVKQNSINLAGDTTPPVPEPATWGMMLLGFAGIGVAMRRSRRRNGALMQVA